MRRSLAVALSFLFTFGGSATPVAAAPTNDAFAHASVIGSVPFTGNGDNTSATLQAGEPVPSCYTDTGFDNTIWWRYDVPANAKLVATPGGGSVFAIYRGTRLSALTELDCSGSGRNLNFSVRAGDTIYFQIGDYSGGGGQQSFQLRRQ